MILEIDTSILVEYQTYLIINQYSLTLVLSDIKVINQDIQKLLSLVNEEEIQELANQGLISINNSTDNQVISKTSKLDELLKEDKTMFVIFMTNFQFTLYALMELKGFLRANVNKCRKEYNRIVGKSKAIHEHIMDCLRYEIDDKMRTGKMGYMKTMWKWLTQHEWETFEEQMKLDDYQPNTYNYGTDVI